MSELKEWTASEIEEYDDARLELAEDGKIDCTRVYIKEDVDKVIADLKEKHKTEVKELLCLIRDKENNFNRAFDSEEKEIRSQKYKRCLDKANYWLAVSYKCIDDKHRQNAEKHHYKWLEIAKKFKMR